MDLNVKDKWIRSLLQEDYIQGYGALRKSDNTFDPTGVLCDLFDSGQWVDPFDYRNKNDLQILNHIEKTDSERYERVVHSITDIEDIHPKDRSQAFLYLNKRYHPPDDVIEWADLPDQLIMIRGVPLNVWNDHYRLSFVEIAQIIEDEL